MKCKTHPKYRGIRKPRCECVACWKIYAERVEQERDELATICDMNMDLSLDHVSALFTRCTSVSKLSKKIIHGKNAKEIAKRIAKREIDKMSRAYNSVG